MWWTRLAPKRSRAAPRARPGAGARGGVVDVGHHRFGPRAGLRGAEPVHDEVERLVPSGARAELAGALRPGAQQRCHRRARARHAPRVVLDLLADEAVREGVAHGRVDLHDPPVGDRHLGGTGVGTVQRARGDARRGAGGDGSACSCRQSRAGPETTPPALAECGRAVTGSVVVREADRHRRASDVVGAPVLGDESLAGQVRPRQVIGTDAQPRAGARAAGPRPHRRRWSRRPGSRAARSNGPRRGSGIRPRPPRGRGGTAARDRSRAGCGTRLAPSSTAWSCFGFPVISPSTPRSSSRFHSDATSSSLPLNQTQTAMCAACASSTNCRVTISSPE